MKHYFFLGFVLAGLGAVSLDIQAADLTWPSLKVGPRTLTNVTVMSRTPVEIFVRHTGGIESLKLRDIDPARQRELGFNPDAAQGVEKARAASAERWRDKEEKEYRLRDGSRFRLAVPRLWKTEEGKAPPSLPESVTVRFSPMQGQEFVVMVTVQLPRDESQVFDLRQALNYAGRKALQQAVETRLDITEIGGEQVTGGYFSTTDRNLVNQEPKPGDYKYMTQGIAKIGHAALTFTVLSNQADPADKKLALEMLRHATLSAPAAASL